MSATASAPSGLEGLDALQGVDLATVVGATDLQRRFDRKYVIESSALPRLLGGLRRDIRVLEIEGRRSSSYTSVYFDTPELRTYHDHLKRRRRRFKIRTRHYGDPAQTLIEVKCKGARGQSVKHRWPHPGAAVDRLGPEAERLISAALGAEYGFDLPCALAAVATIEFERVTLVDLVAAERVTIDFGLSVEANGHRRLLGARHAVVETKTSGRRGAATGALTALGIRPDRISKYCVAIAASHEHVRGNPWLPVLRRLTGASGAQAAA